MTAWLGRVEFTRMTPGSTAFSAAIAITASLQAAAQLRARRAGRAEHRARDRGAPAHRRAGRAYLWPPICEASQPDRRGPQPILRPAIASRVLPRKGRRTPSSAVTPGNARKVREHLDVREAPRIASIPRRSSEPERQGSTTENRGVPVRNGRAVPAGAASLALARRARSFSGRRACRAPPWIYARARDARRQEHALTPLLRALGSAPRPPAS